MVYGHEGKSLFLYGLLSQNYNTSKIKADLKVNVEQLDIQNIGKLLLIFGNGKIPNYKISDRNLRSMLALWKHFTSEPLAQNCNSSLKFSSTIKLRNFIIPFYY